MRGEDLGICGYEGERSVGCREDFGNGHHTSQLDVFQRAGASLDLHLMALPFASLKLIAKLNNGEGSAFLFVCLPCLTCPCSASVAQK